MTEGVEDILFKIVKKNYRNLIRDTLLYYLSCKPNELIIISLILKHFNHCLNNIKIIYIF